MNQHGQPWVSIATLGAAALALLLVPGLVAPASAAPTALSGSVSQQWAYGAEKWVNVTESFGNATYSAHAFLGWHVVYTATNTSSSTVALEAQRTVAGSYYASLCSPNCSSAIGQGNLSIVGWETDTGFANLTTNASVLVNGSAVAAVGLLNASARSAGNISELFWFSLRNSSQAWNASTVLDLAGHASAQVEFAPALGLVPLVPSPGEHWSSASNFSASGMWAISAFYAHTGLFGVSSHATYNPSGSVQGSGTVTVVGADLGTVTLRDGETVPVLALGWTGPFDDVDGLILIPHDFDLFGDQTHDWSTVALGAESISTSNLDVTVDAAHHLRVVAASASYASADTSLANQAAPMSGRAPASTSSAATEVQAQPESVAQAQQGSACLVGNCPSVSPPVRSLGSLAGLVLVLGLVIGLVVGAVSVVEYRVWARRRAERGLIGTPSPIRNGSPPPGATGVVSRFAPAPEGYPGRTSPPKPPAP